jgi:tetratricopeptide (TPR) repeat protein
MTGITAEGLSLEQPLLPEAPSAADFIGWNPEEGLYQRGGSLIVVARYNESNAAASTEPKLAYLLLRVGDLMKRYVAASQFGVPADDYSRDLSRFASRQIGAMVYPTANRELRRETTGNGGTLILEFFDGVDLLRKCAAALASIGSDKLTSLYKREILRSHDEEELRGFAKHNGEVIQTLIFAAASFEQKRRLASLQPLTRDVLLDRDAVLRLYCNQSPCALRPEVHLSQAKILMIQAPEKALIHLFLARLSADADTTRVAGDLLDQTLADDRFDKEFSTVLRMCDGIAPADPHSLSGRILRNCGIYWPVGAASAAMPEGLDAKLTAVNANFSKGVNPEETLKLLESVLDDAPNQARAWSLAGSLFLFMGLYPGAAAAYHQVLLLAPDSIDARMYLADAYLGLKCPSLAGALYKDVVDRAEVGEKSEDHKNIKEEALARIHSNRLQ